MKTIQTIKITIFFDVIFLIMLIVFLLQGNAILLHLESLKEWLVFHDFSYVLKYKQDTYFSFLAYRTLRLRLRLTLRSFLSIFFQSSFSDG